MRGGTLIGTLVQGTFQMGDYGVKAIIDILGGNKVAAQIDTGAVLVTKDNIDAPQAQNALWRGSQPSFPDPLFSNGQDCESNVAFGSDGLG